MKKVIDNFSKQSSSYKKFRPEYPKQLYEFILSQVDNRDQCWDCGTGNGQVAKELSKYFKKVKATDISENQLNLSEKAPNIEYQISRAERTSFREDQFDLITVAQAIHWFDIKAFNSEVRRVGKNGSKIFVWGYSLLSIDDKTDEIIKDFYHNIIGPYWNKERKHVDQKYESIKLEFKELKSPGNLSIESRWRVADLIGYLNSWSSVQNYLKSNNENPIEKVEKQLSKIWSKEDTRLVRFPIFMKTGLIEK